MDGPNFNLKLWKDLCAIMKEDPESLFLRNIGSCDRHILHGTVKAAIKNSSRTIVVFLHELYCLVKDSPAQKAKFVKCTGCKTFPLKFSAVRWVENIAVVIRVEEILPHIRKFIRETEKDKHSVTACSSLDVVSKALKDKFLRAELSFFTVVANLVEPFLVNLKLRSLWYLFCTMSSHQLSKIVMERVLKPEVFGVSSLKKIYVSQNSNLVPVKKIDLGFSIRSALKKLNATKL
ncbi:hypothetical protein PR048_023504 [Dryococelus australis]|uniref:Uncharacterized protein n=1 Tax=Dryococelus australis TaxID=614101 RepID=A0ABQ9GU97_9NEOP|nr:hypothetical protein PR048_023504 [Dryococelus australis]